MAAEKKQSPIPARREELFRELQKIDPNVLTELVYGTERWGIAAAESFRDKFRDVFKDKTAIETIGEVVERQ